MQHDDLKLLAQEISIAFNELTIPPEVLKAPEPSRWATFFSYKAPTVISPEEPFEALKEFIAKTQESLLQPLNDESIDSYDMMMKDLNKHIRAVTTPIDNVIRTLRNEDKRPSKEYLDYLLKLEQAKYFSAQIEAFITHYKEKITMLMDIQSMKEFTTFMSSVGKHFKTIKETHLEVYGKTETSGIEKKNTDNYTPAVRSFLVIEKVIACLTHIDALSKQAGGHSAKWLKLPEDAPIRQILMHPENFKSAKEMKESIQNLVLQYITIFNLCKSATAVELGIKNRNNFVLKFFNAHSNAMCFEGAMSILVTFAEDEDLITSDALDKMFCLSKKEMVQNPENIDDTKENQNSTDENNPENIAEIKQEENQNSPEEKPQDKTLAKIKELSKDKTLSDSEDLAKAVIAYIGDRFEYLPDDIKNSGSETIVSALVEEIKDDEEFKAKLKDMVWDQCSAIGMIENRALTEIKQLIGENATLENPALKSAVERYIKEQFDSLSKNTKDGTVENIASELIDDLDEDDTIKVPLKQMFLECAPWIDQIKQDENQKKNTFKMK